MVDWITTSYKDLKHILDKVTKCHCHTLSNKVICRGKKSVILAIFQKEPGWPCPTNTGPSKIPHRISKILLVLVSYKSLKRLEDKLRIILVLNLIKLQCGCFRRWRWRRQLILQQSNIVPLLGFSFLSMLSARTRYNIAICLDPSHSIYIRTVSS